MQSLVRRVVVEQNPHGRAKSHSILYTFSSILKPSQPHLHQRNHIPSSFLTHQSLHFHSCRSFSSKLRPFLSRSMISRCFAFNSLLGVRARSLSLDHRSILQYFRRHNFNFNYNSEFSRRSWRSWLRGLTSNDMVLGLIIANVGIFLLWRIADEKFMMNNFTISLDNIKSGRLHTLITNAFSHVDTWHIVSNMVGLYFFGLNGFHHVALSFIPTIVLIAYSLVSWLVKKVGRNFGPEFLLKLYLAGAVVGAVFYLIHQAYKAQTSKDLAAMIATRELALGASGAVNAVMLLDIFLFPKATLYLDFFIPVPAILLGIFFIGRDMLRILEGDSRVSGSVHLGGAVVAAIAWAGVRKGRF